MAIKIETTVSINNDELADVISENCSEKQKLEIANKMCHWGATYDMGFVEKMLVMYAKIGLKRIKKNSMLYNRNRAYFNALKTIAKLKEAN